MRLVLLFLVLVTACKSIADNNPLVPVELQLVGTFASPVYLTSPPNDTARRFIVEQAGRVRISRHDTTLARAFLDLRGRISSGDERGLLSLAFHPLYATNGRFYVYFTDSNGDIRVVRYNVSSDPDSADEATADTVLKVAHPGQANHNGGQLQFGNDGMLFVGTGDGGGGGDPDENAQNKHALLGKILRLDVNGASGYTIPSTNPFATDTSGAPEVWSYGLRNPWRFSFDRQTGDLYIGDVGQGDWEEVNVATVALQRGRGANYGWNIMEGNHCYPTGPCNTAGLVTPFVEYSHAFGACTVVGGYVYRGSAIPELDGHYFYADFCNGAVTSFKLPNPVTINWTSLLRPGNNVSSFGQDAKGELYIMQLGGGVYRIVPAP